MIHSIELVAVSAWLIVAVVGSAWVLKYRGILPIPTQLKLEYSRLSAECSYLYHFQSSS